MGFHNVLTGEDLHEPSRVRIVNSIPQNTLPALLPGRLVRLDGAVVEGILTVSDLATDGDILVGFVDTVIAAGNEGTVVLFGRLLEVEVENPTTNTIKEGDFVRVNSNSRFEKTNINEGRVGIVLRRGVTTSPTMNVLFNPLSASKEPVPQYLSLDNPDGLRRTPLTAVMGFATGQTISASADIEFSNMLNSGLFRHTSESDSLALTNPALITVKKTGAYELTTSDALAFNGTFVFIDQVQPTSTETIGSFNIIIRRNRQVGGSTERVELLRAEVSQSFVGAGNNTLDFNRNLRPSSSTALSEGASSFASGPGSKIVNLEENDTIVVSHQYVSERTPAATSAGNVLAVYSGETSFDFFFSLKRVQ